MIALEKAKPGKLSIVVDGPRNSSMLLATWLNKRAGIGLQLISYTNNPLFLQAADGIRVIGVTGVQTCALPISRRSRHFGHHAADRQEPRGVRPDVRGAV